MSEQKTEGQVEGQQLEQTEGSKEPQYTPVQLKAIEQGWIPKEDFDGEADEFIDAPEFIRRGELFAKISSQNKRMQALEDALGAMKQHNSRIKQVEYERAVKAVKAEMRKARVEGDHDREFALEDRLEEIQAEAKSIEREAQNDAPKGETAEFQDWVAENPWYNSNEVMREAADAIGRKLHATGKYSLDEVFEEVTKRIKKEFEHKFKTPAKKGSPVEGSSRKSDKGDDNFSMTEIERDMMKKIVKTGVMTEAEYKAQLKATR